MKFVVSGYSILDDDEVSRCVACTRVYLDSQHALPVPGKQ